MKLRALYRLSGFTLPSLALLVFIPTAGAQSLLVEGLEAMTDAAATPAEFQDVARIAREAYEELGTEFRELESLRRNAPGFLVYDADGNAVSVSEAQAQDLAETLATDLVFADDRYATVQALLARAGNGGDLDRAVAFSIFGVLALQTEHRRAGIPARSGDLVPQLSETLLTLLEEADRGNRDAIRMELNALEGERDAVFALAERAAAGAAGRVEDAGSATDCRGLGCYDVRAGRFINGRGIGTGEYEHTAATCAARCDAEARCLSFEMYNDDYCSINVVKAGADTSILSESDDYTYYEHRFRGEK